jgi:hypothetical protein
MTIKGSYPTIHGPKLGISKDDQTVARGGLVAGGGTKPSIVFPAPDTVALFEDFLTDMSGTSAVDTGAAGQFFLAKCTDTGVKGALVAGTNGVFEITSSATITTATPAGSSKTIVGRQLAWKANQGPGAHSGRLRMAARVKASQYPTKTSGDWSGFFVGFTDSTAHEVPIHDTGRTGDSGASAVSTASDLVGFLWGTGGDTGIRGVSATSGSGGANDSGDQQVTLTTVLPTANTWMVLEVEVQRGAGDTGGTATFFIDGVPKGKINSPVNPAVALTPVVSYYDTGGAGLFDVDWINCSAARDTGL